MAKTKTLNGVVLETVLPKKKVVRFETDDENAAIGNIYVRNDLVEELGGCENGVRVTLEAL